MNKRISVNIIVLLVLNVLVVYSGYSQDEISIIPRPNAYKMGNGNFEINKETTIYFAEMDLKFKEYVIASFKEMLNYSLKTSPKRPKKNYISFQIELPHEPSSEGYVLNVDHKKTEIKASSEQGLFYGLQSLRQLVAAGSQSAEATILPQVSIQDSPRFSWRAFMLDEARHFKGKQEVKKLLNEMALLKMNVFHWHLVDDQGWRIEIKKYPLLTEIGSARESTQIGPKQWKSKIQSGEPHAGFYSQDDIIEIVEYASERHITIVPEIEMPGHSSSAIAAYPWLGASGKKIDVPVNFGVGKDVYDVANPKVFQFLTDVLDEVMELFPSKVIHIGGDEIRYDFWKESPTIQAYMARNGLNSPADLQVFFTNRISRHIESRGRRMMGWNEILGHNLHYYQDASDTKVDQKLGENSVVHFWKGDLSLAQTAAEGGYDIVNSIHSSTYLDYDYKDIPLKKAYDFDPIPVGLNQKYHIKVIGTGCQMWSEWIPSKGQMHFQVFPRIAAYAEVGWTQLTSKNYELFQEALGRLEDRWKSKKIYFAPRDISENREVELKGDGL